MCSRLTTATCRTSTPLKGGCSPTTLLYIGITRYTRGLLRPVSSHNTPRWTSLISFRRYARSGLTTIGILRRQQPRPARFSKTRIKPIAPFTNKREEPGYPRLLCVYNVPHRKLQIKQCDNRNSLEIFGFCLILVCSYLVELLIRGFLNYLVIIKMVIFISDNHYRHSMIPSIFFI